MQATSTCSTNSPEADAPASGPPLRPSLTARIVNQPGPDRAAPGCGTIPAGGGAERRLVQAVPLQLLGVTSQHTLVRGFMRFKNSWPPLRVLFYAGDQWNDFTPEVVWPLIDAFVAGKAVVDVPVGDSLYVFDFVRMLRINVATNAQSSIAWIDRNGGCFFPKAPVERSVVCPKLEIEVRINENGGAVPWGEPIEREPSEEHSDESQVMAVDGDAERRLVHAVPLQLLGVTSQDNLVTGFMQFKNSWPPVRILFYAGDQWNDFPPEVVRTLIQEFEAGKAVVDVPIGDSLYLFDFVRMLQIHVATNAQNSIAWLDTERGCFFPKVPIEKSVVCPKPEVEVRINDKGGAVPAGEPIEREHPEEHSDESQVMPVARRLERQREAGLEVLDEGHKLYKIVANLFLKGMRMFVPETTITSICKCSYAGLSANQRSKAFLRRIEMTKAARGTANLKFGWYGTSASGITNIINHGFGQPNNSLLGSGMQATGVYLAPPNSPHSSSVLLEADDGGEKHVILCRIIMGNAEKVDTFSAQWHPSNDNFDCGVDDLEKPTWYIVWGTHMNTHILPEYVVSFRTSDSGSRGKETFRIGKGIVIPITNLLAELGNFLPSSRMEVLENLCNQLKERKISRDIFLRNFRAIAGANLLSTVTKKYHRRL